MRTVVLATAVLLSGVFLASAARPTPQANTALFFARSELKLAGKASAPWTQIVPRGRLSLAQPAPLEAPPPPTAREALATGILIVISISSQKAFVLRRGELWASSEVSTGKAGHDTPTGEFTILQKKKVHRSSLYDDALMPFMQRLTWDGVALHAGRIPGYPASHGCIRLPPAFAEKLYGITNFSSTVVLVTNDPVRSVKEARNLT